MDNAACAQKWTVKISLFLTLMIQKKELMCACVFVRIRLRDIVHIFALWQRVSNNRANEKFNYFIVENVGVWWRPN